eukprot:1113419-Pleurochrysis_carterae.AAC.2
MRTMRSSYACSWALLRTLPRARTPHPLQNRFSSMSPLHSRRSSPGSWARARLPPSTRSTATCCLATAPRSRPSTSAPPPSTPRAQKET